MHMCVCDFLYGVRHIMKSHAYKNAYEETYVYTLER